MIHLIGRSLATVLAGFVFAAVPAFAGCKGLSAKDVGTRLGTAMLDVGAAFAEAGVWSFPNCHKPKDEKIRQMCKRMEKAADAAEELNKSADRGCFDDEGSYEQSADFYVFRVLRDGLSSPDPRIRWEALLQMFSMCGGGTMITDAGEKGCGREVEKAALELLNVDQDPMNRHLALEVLASRLATEHSRSILEQIARTGKQMDSLCLHGFASEHSTYKDHATWDRIARQIRESKMMCERQLAQEALIALDKRRAETK